MMTAKKHEHNFVYSAAASGPGMVVTICAGCGEGRVTGAPATRPNPRPLPRPDRDPVPPLVPRIDPDPWRKQRDPGRPPVWINKDWVPFVSDPPWGETDQPVLTVRVHDERPHTGSPANNFESYTGDPPYVSPWVNLMSCGSGTWKSLTI